jgi:hypothetical protein
LTVFYGLLGSAGIKTLGKHVGEIDTKTFYEQILCVLCSFYVLKLFCFFLQKETSAKAACKKAGESDNRIFIDLFFT